jgi:hypothetical protein
VNNAGMFLRAQKRFKNGKQPAWRKSLDVFDDARNQADALVESLKAAIARA